MTRHRRGLAALALLVVVLAALLLVREARDDPAPAPAPTATAAPSVAPTAAAGPQQTTLGDQRVAYRDPAQPTTKAVIYAHGRGGNALSPFDPGPLGRVTQALVDAGYVVAASDAHGNAWGNPASVADQVALAQWLRARGQTQLYLYAESMGGLSSLLAAPQIQPRAWAGVYPVCDISSVTAFDSEITGIWGTTTPPGLAPVPTPPGLPVLAWASPGDTLVPKARNADVCAAGDVITTTGDHADPSNFDPARVVAFFGEHP